jgi:mediator of RNA polymerase II transcription subunit 17
LVPAAPAFKNRSLAALRRSPDGTVFLDQGITESTPKRLRIRIRTQGEITGQFIPPATVPDSAPLEDLVLRARNAIFEDELWQELNREGRILTNQGVRCLGPQITCKISAHKTILLDLLPGEDDASSLATSLTHEDDGIAHMISLSLRLLLSAAHQQSYRRRTSPPAPINTRPPSSTPYALIRPIIARLQFHSILSNLSALLKHLQHALSRAGLSDGPWTLRHGSLDASHVAPSLQSTPERILEWAVLHLEAVFSIILTKSTETAGVDQILTVRLRTSLWPLDTRFQISVTGPLAQSCKPPQNPSSFEEVKAYILWATGCAIGESLAAPFNADNLDDAMNGVEVSEAKQVGTGIKGWYKTSNPTVLQKTFKNEAESREIAFSVVAEEKPESGSGMGLIEVPNLEVVIKARVKEVGGGMVETGKAKGKIWTWRSTGAEAPGAKGERGLRWVLDLAGRWNGPVVKEEGGSTNLSAGEAHIVAGFR